MEIHVVCRKKLRERQHARRFKPEQPRSKSERGATAVEYALMVGLLGIGIIASVSTLKDRIQTTTSASGCAMSAPGSGQAIPIDSGWTLAAANVDVVSYWPSPTEVNSMDLDGTVGSAGSVTRNLTTTVGQNYCLSYWLAGNVHGAPTVKTLTVTVGSTTQSQSFDITGKTDANMGWVRKNIRFVATATSTPLTFTSTGGSDTGP